jgi:hypothetical protein
MSSFVQPNFLGGEWSPRAQGRVDEETYRTAMNVCVNGLPVESGGWVRRPGTKYAGTTRGGFPAVLRDFHFSENAPYTAEFTAGFLRFFAGLGLVTEPVIAVKAISTANPAVLQTVSAPGWATGDQVSITPGTVPQPGQSILFNRVWSITVVDTTHFSLSDPITGATLDGSTLSGSGALWVGRVLTYATPYIASLDALRLVQGTDTNGRVLALLFHPSAAPGEIITTKVPSTSGYAQFTYTQSLTFTDGPYLNFPSDGSTLTPTGTSGTITLTASAATSINNGAGFQSTDVGRLIRLFSEPAAWVSGTNYTTGAVVKYANAYWKATNPGSGNIPGAAIAGAATPQWFLFPQGAIWTWGTIATVTNSTTVTLTLAAADPEGILAGGPLLYTNAITTWAMGVYSATTGWPTGGTFHDGRFWTFGGLPNRVDGSRTNSTRGPLDFAPTDLYGNVLDDSGCFETASTDDTNTIFWAISLYEGAIILGTESGEFLLQASNIGDPITPTSIQIHRQTKYKCANVEPRWTGLSVVFTQAYHRNLMEYVSDAYSRKLTASNLSEKARHLTVPGIQEIAYQYELTPVVWARLGDGTLIGCTYKRESPFGTAPPKFVGWHRHKLGSNRKVLSIQSGPSSDGTLDTLALCTQDPVTQICYVEFLSTIFDEGQSLLNAFFTDAGGAPSSAQYIAGTPDIVRLYGLQYLAGDTITVFGAGLDLGDYTVSATGTVDLPVGVAGSLFTKALLASLTPQQLGTPIQTATGNSTVYGAQSVLPSSNAGANFLVDWNNFNGYAIGSGNGVMSYNLKTLANLENYTDAGAVVPATMDVNGNIYWSQFTSNQGTLYKTSTNAAGQLTRVASWGVSGSAINTDNNHMASPFAMTTIQFQGSNYLLNSWLVGNNLDLINTDAMRYTGHTIGYAGGTSRMFLSRGVGASAYGMVVHGASGITTYQASVGSSGFSLATLGAIAPATVDATWTSIDNAAGVTYDETDGNLIVWVSTTASVAHKLYCIKINAASGGLMWATPFDGVTQPTQFTAQFSRARAGRLDLIVGGQNGVTIDTTSGTVLQNVGSQPNQLTNQTTDGATGTVIGQSFLDNKWYISYGSAGANVSPPGNYSVPFALGFTYTSQGQILRSILPQETQTPGGPALGKKRRLHQFSMLLDSTQGLSAGTDFTHLRALQFRFANNTAYAINQLFSGVYWDHLDDDYSYDSMLCWQITRPYPAQVVTVQGFLQAHDT